MYHKMHMTGQTKRNSKWREQSKFVKREKPSRTLENLQNRIATRLIQLTKESSRVLEAMLKIAEDTDKKMASMDMQNKITIHGNSNLKSRETLDQEQKGLKMVLIHTNDQVRMSIQAQLFI